VNIGEIWNKFIGAVNDAVMKLAELWFGKSQTRLYSPVFDTNLIDDRTINSPTLYSGEYAQRRMQQLGLDEEGYRRYLETYLERQIYTVYQNNFTRAGNVVFDSSIFRKKKDPGAPYNKYPIVKTKFLDGYQPNKI